MRLIVITPDNRVNDEARIINDLFVMGLQRLHLRKPSFTNDDYRKYLAAIDGQWYDRIALHDCYELYQECKLGGIHLNSLARADKTIWQQLENIPPSAISTSFHAWEEIEQNTFSYGYVFISPVFDSISKAGYKAGLDIAGAKKVKQRFAEENRYCPSIIGLGGVGVNELELLHNSGFDGAAMLGAIWQAKDPIDAFANAKTKISSLPGD